MSDIARAVFAHWKRTGIQRDDPQDLRFAPEYLARLERQRNVELPESFRVLWQLSDGTAAMDDDEFTFWPLDNILDDPSLPSPRSPNAILFADCCLGAIQFFAWFEDGVPCGVSRLRDTAPTEIERIAGSFDEFLENYLRDPRTLGKAHPARSS